MHHPPDDLLASYAAGTSDEGESLLVATHLALCPRCRDVCTRLDHIGGGLMGPIPAEPVAADALDRLLGRLDEPLPPVVAPPPPEGPNDVPLPLRAHTGPLSRVRFSRAGVGIERFDLPMSRPNRPVALVSLRPGMTVPPHRHAGVERGLVLQGGYQDETGHFARGDVQVRFPDDLEPHAQRIDDGERCIVFMVDDGEKLPTTWTGRLVALLFGRAAG
jgi:putative transcriptional regulator